MVIVWSNFAKTNLRDFLSNTYMEHSNAIEYIKSLYSYVQSLENNNYLGKSLSYLHLSEFRQLIYKKHRILYSIQSNEIHIIAVIHIAQDLNKVISDISKYANY